VEAVETPKPKRRIGSMEGMFEVPDDYKTMGRDEIIAMFEGED
jgi:hypothetical protein